MVNLGPNAKDLVFNFEVAESAALKFDGAADDIDGQAGSRGHYETTASKDFQGFYAELFAERGCCQFLGDF